MFRPVCTPLSNTSVSSILNLELISVRLCSGVRRLMVAFLAKPFYGYSSSFSCPNGTKAIGYSAASACLGLNQFQVRSLMHCLMKVVFRAKYVFLVFQVRSDLEPAEKANVLSLLCHDLNPKEELKCLVWALLCQH